MELKMELLIIDSFPFIDHNYNSAMYFDTSNEEDTKKLIEIALKQKKYVLLSNPEYEDEDEK